MKWSRIFKDHLSRILLFALLMLVAFVILLYYFGVFDISFIERPASWNKSVSDILAVFTRTPESTLPETQPPTSQPETTAGQDQPAETTEPTDDPTPLYAYASVAELQKLGYRLTDAAYDSSMELGVLSPARTLPSFDYFRTMTVQKLVYTYASAKAELYNDRTASYIAIQTPRPCVMLYMGYIIVDEDPNLTLLNNAGAKILSYPTDEYLPAYTRQKDGKPLFYKTKEIEYTIPATYEEIDGELVETTPARPYVVSTKEYYYVDEAKGKFVLSSYNDVTDNRGLYFDYPAYFGVGDSNVSREVQLTDHFFTDLKGKDTYEILTLWRYRGLTGYNYSRAYPYSEGRAVVEYTYELTRTDSDDVEHPYTIVAMQILNEKGKVLFRPYRTFRYETWYLYEWYMLPDSYGEESIGFFYYDHGLMRVRRQRVDYYFWVNSDTRRVMEDTDLLLDLDGNIVPTPAGLTLVGYSDGMILLKDHDGNYGYYNSHMVRITDPIYKDAKPFSEGLGVVCSQDGLWGVIDAEGNTVIPCIFSQMSQVSSGLLAGYRNGSWTIFQKMAKS